jgi:hypothetical protein
MLHSSSTAEVGALLARRLECRQREDAALNIKGRQGSPTMRQGGWLAPVAPSRPRRGHPWHGLLRAAAVVPAAAAPCVSRGRRLDLGGVGPGGAVRFCRVILLRFMSAGWRRGIVCAHEPRRHSRFHTGTGRHRPLCGHAGWTRNADADKRRMK